MDPKILKKTQETLGKAIKKPPLTEKLLNKPPFRFLHDIITEVIKNTGILGGLYTENELNSANVTDKEAKMNFLQKAIDCVGILNGDPLTGRPSKIVAGHEPEKTNEFLQQLGKICLKKTDTSSAVKKVLAGEKPSGKKKSSSSKSKEEDKESKSKEKDESKPSKSSEKPEKDGKKEKSEDKKDSDGKDKERKDDKERRRDDKERKSREMSGSSKNKEEKREDRKDRKGDSRESKDKEDKEESRTREESSKERSKKDRNGSSKDRKEGKSKEREKSSKDREGSSKDRASSSKDREDKPREKSSKERESQLREEDARDSDGGKGRKGSSKERSKEKGERERRSEKEKERNSEKFKEKKDEPDEDEQLLDPDLPDEGSKNLQRPASAKGQRRRPSGSEDDGKDKESDLMENENQEETNQNDSRKMSAMKRPSSARPAPPRIKKQEVQEEQQPRINSGKAVAPVIVDTKKDQDEEDDDTFIVEEDPTLQDMLEVKPSDSNPDFINTEEHGSLVRKMLESKKEADARISSANKKEEKPIIFDAARKKEREMVEKEIEKLRNSIQLLVRSAHPLGKIMDYVQEDIDSMQKELNVWKNENKKHEQALKAEQCITDNEIAPLRAHLNDIEQEIAEVIDNISVVKSNIIRNDEKIEELVMGVNR